MGHVAGIETNVISLLVSDALAQTLFAFNSHRISGTKHLHTGAALIYTSKIEMLDSRGSPQKAGGAIIVADLESGTAQ